MSGVSDTEARKAGSAEFPDGPERRSDEGLRESEERWRSVAENAPNIIVVAARDGTIEYINRTVPGLTVEGTVGKKLYDFVEPEYHDAMREVTESVFDTGEPGSYQIKGAGPDGSVSWYDTQVVPIKRDGQVVAATLITTDITERKRAEETLLYKNALLEAQHETSLDGTLVVDAEGKTVSYNGRFAEMWRIPQELLATRDDNAMLDFVLGQLKDPEGFSRRVRYLYAHRDEKSEDQIGFKDGRVFDRYSSPLLDSNGTYHGRVWYFRDVTDRKRAEEALRESEELHRTLMDALPDAVAMTDLEGRITYASPRMLEMHGFENAEELVGKAGVELVVPEEREEAIAAIKQRLEGRPGKVNEYTLMRKDGSRFPAEACAALVRDAHGEPKAFVTVSRDITERKQAEEALREAEGRREELALEVAELRSDAQGRYGPESIIGRDPKMRAIYKTILAVSRTNATVLIQGDTGTGKELVAKAVHYNSSRRDRPFVKVDCGALAENLLESELFGHVKGAFTGAVRERAGRFELAADATIFLDEIHNLSIPLQAKLLRVVQEGRFEKVGGTETIEVDVRIVAATNEDLEALVEQGRFRKDLYYRVNVIPIKLPPLRDRRGDIPLLAQSFIKRFSERHAKNVTGVSKEALDKLTGYDWPGNVRELENIVEQAVVFSRGPTIQAGDVRLPRASPAAEKVPLPGPSPQPLRKALAVPEKRLLKDALARTRGNKKKAAELLGISRSVLYAKLKRHGIPTKK